MDHQERGVYTNKMARLQLRLRLKHASAALLCCTFLLFCTLALRGGFVLTTEDANANPFFSHATLTPWMDPVAFDSEARRMLQDIDPHSARAEFHTVAALSSLLPPLREVPRTKTPPAEDFIEHVASVGFPIILTDMIEGTRLRRWSWKYLRARFGDTVFHNTRQGEYFDTANRLGKQEINRVSVKFSDFIDVVTKVRAPRMHEQDLYITKQHLPKEALAKEFVWPPFYTAENMTKCFLEPTGWIGSEGTFTQGHFDSKDNFAYQIIGQKQWTIYPPTDYENLYFVPAKGGLEWSQALNSQTLPNLEQFPLYVKTHPLSFTLNEGEVLYLPRGWTHTVKNLTPSLMINVWRKGPAGITAPWIEKNAKEIKRLCTA